MSFILDGRKYNIVKLDDQNQLSCCILLLADIKLGRVFLDGRKIALSR